MIEVIPPTKKATVVYGNNISDDGSAVKYKTTANARIKPAKNEYSYLKNVTAPYNDNDMSSKKMFTCDISAEISFILLSISFCSSSNS